MEEAPERGSTTEALVEERRAKRDALRARGIDPYPSRFDRTDTAAELHERYADLEPDTRTGAEVRVAGRVSTIRGHGKLVFATVHDMSGAIQLLMSDSKLEPDAARGAREPRPRRLGRRGGRGDHQPPRRAVGGGDVVDPPRQSRPTSSRQVARPQRRGHALPPTGSRPPGERGHPTGLRHPFQDARLASPDLLGGGLRRGRDPGAPESGRRRAGPAVLHSFQCARHRLEPSHRARAVPQALGGRRVRAGLRDLPQLPQRGDRHSPQSRVHLARGLLARSATCTTAWT